MDKLKEVSFNNRDLEFGRMTRLDDYLSPLEEGECEVIVEKEEVTEPLDGWEKSAFNLPLPG